MEDKESPESRARYVWDRDKMAWVESGGQAVQEEAGPQQEIAAAPYEDASEPVSAAMRLTEAGEEVQLRGAWARLAAVILDFIFLALFNLIISTATGLSRDVYQYMLPVFGIAYFIGFWAWRGQTPGKMIIGARIVRTDGSAIGLPRAIVRYLGYFVYLAAIEASVAYVSWILAIVVSIVIFLFVVLSRDKRGLHDRIAGTIVINTRPKTLEEYVEGEYEEEEASYPEAEEEPLVSEKA